MRDFGNIIVIEDLLWEKWPIKYRNALIANESEYFMNYVLYRLKELDKISDIFNMYPENISDIMILMRVLFLTDN